MPTLQQQQHQEGHHRWGDPSVSINRGEKHWEFLQTNKQGKLTKEWKEPAGAVLGVARGRARRKPTARRRDMIASSFASSFSLVYTAASPRFDSRVSLPMVFSVFSSIFFFILFWGVFSLKYRTSGNTQDPKYWAYIRSRAWCSWAPMKPGFDFFKWYLYEFKKKSTFGM